MNNLLFKICNKLKKVIFTYSESNPDDFFNAFTDATPSSVSEIVETENIMGKESVIFYCVYLLFVFTIFFIMSSIL